MREEAQPTSHGTACHHPPRAELRQEATARVNGPWSRHTPTAPRTNVRRSAAAHPAGACCAGIYTPQPMARRLRLLTHGLKNAHPLRGLPMSFIPWITPLWPSRVYRAGRKKATGHCFACDLFYFVTGLSRGRRWRLRWRQVSARRRRACGAPPPPRRRGRC